MNKKYLMRGFAALALVAGFSSCVKDVDGISPAEEAEKAKENAELQLGLQIPEGQSWNMSTQVTANVNVSKKAGETYRVTVYSNNPLADGKGVFLTRGTINNGETFTGKFTCGSGVKSLYVGLTDSKGYTVYKQAKVENGRLDLTFGNVGNGSRSMRAAYTVGNDTYDFFDVPTAQELAAVYPSSIPSNLASNSVLNDYNALQPLVYENGVPRQTLANFAITTAGEYTVGGGLQNTRWISVTGHPNGGYQQPDPVNIYVAVGANEKVTFKRNGNFQFNLYILSGTVELASNFGEMGTLFSVGTNATLIDNRSTFSDNAGVKLYNRGTFRTGSAYSIGNNAFVYNEGKFYVNGALDYIAGSWNDPRFFNVGDNVELTAASFTLNSNGGFISDGTVNITGATTVTQSGIIWVNNGKYTTGSLKFSAHNSTFYNYCQLNVTGTTTFTDGKFNLMTGSYTKMQHGIFNNFIVDMYNNSMVNITGGTKWGRQGNGTFQGFRTASSDATAYVVLGGDQQYVPAHTDGAFQLAGAGLTAAISNMKFYDEFDELGVNSTWESVHYSKEVTAESLAANSDGRITWLITDAQVTDIEGASVTEPAEGQCSATIEEEEYPIYDEPQVYSYAFEDQIYNGDYDMNDIVLKATFPSTKNRKGEIIAIDSTKLQITMVAAGATFKIKAFVGETALFDGQEIHDAFGVNQGVMVNTGNGKAQTATPVVDVIDIPDGIIDADGNADFSQLNVWIWVNPETGYASETKIYYLTDKEKPVPYAVMIPADWSWPTERTCITKAYPGAATSTEGVYNEEFSFAKWAETPDAQRTDDMRVWFKYPVGGLTMTNASTNSNN